MSSHIMPTDVERTVFWASIIILAPLSAVASASIIFSILLKFRRDFSAYSVFQLSLADLLISLVCFLFCVLNLSHGKLETSQHPLCMAQAIFTWYCMEVSILWLVVIPINSYRILVLNKPPFTQKEKIIITIICWGIPILSSLLPINSTGTVGESYGQRSGLWCSFSERDKIPQLINISVYYVLALIIIIFCYVKLWLKISKLGNFESNHASTINATSLKIKIDAQRKMAIYPVCYFVVWTPMFLSYIYEAATGNTIPYVAEILVDNLIHIQGILNFIFYGITQNLWSNVLKKFGIIRNASEENGDSPTLENTIHL